MIETIVFFLFAHFVADFVLQSNWMAQNKSKNILALASHVGVYTLTLLAFGLVWFLPNHIIMLSLILSYVITNGAFHFATDFITSKISSSYWQQGRTHAFFVTIGADQLIHNVTLILTYRWIFNV